MLARGTYTEKIMALDPDEDYVEIMRLLTAYEFPWDMHQALSFALYRTFAVPSIGRLLAATGEFTERTQKRYDDTVILLDLIMEEGFEHGRGLEALRRMNAIHRSFDISNDDLRYVLATFVVIPERWIARFGWRQLTDLECRAAVNYLRALGRRMGIRDIPGTYQGFVDLLDDYEVRHFAYDEGARRVSDATLALMTTIFPNNLLPSAVARRMALALMDEPLRQAFRYPAPTRVEQRGVEAVLRLRGRLLRLLPAPSHPAWPKDRKEIRSYPDGYRVAELGQPNRAKRSGATTL